MKTLKIYVILDRSMVSKDKLYDVCKTLAKADVDIVQYRNKESKASDILEEIIYCKKIFEMYNICFMVNDHVRIVKKADVSGVHLGQEDMPVKKAREIIGSKLIGKSTHSVTEARQADTEEIDYLAIGPVFRSPTKPNLRPIGLTVVRKVVETVNKPVYAIGGIVTDNVNLLKNINIDGIVVCSEILRSKNIIDTVQKLRNI